MAIQSTIPRANVAQSKIQWTQEAANKAREKAKFIRVNLEGKKPSTRFLSGYRRSWFNSPLPEENNTVFVPEFRISGTPEAVQAALLNAGVDQGTVQQVLAAAITRDNYQLPEYQDFINQEEAYKKQVKAREPAVAIDWDIIKYCAENVDKAEYRNKGGSVVKGVKLAPGRGSVGRSLKDKVLALLDRQDGTVYDVSNIDMSTGHSGRSVKAPKNMGQAGKTGRITVPGLPIQSNDPQKYQRAIELTFGPQGLQTYAPQIQEFNRQYREYQQKVAQQYQATQMPAAITGGLTQSPRSMIPVAQPQLVPQPRGVAPIAGQTLAPPVGIRPLVPQAPSIRSPTNRLPVVGGLNLPAMTALRQ